MEVIEENQTAAASAEAIFPIKPKTSQQAPPSATIPWVEKYRPGNIGEVVYQEEVVLTLKKAINTSTLPHLLFYGTPGTGKTSTILAIAKQFYRTPKLFKERVLELNASDERGIDVIRHKVKEFGMISTGSASGGSSSSSSGSGSGGDALPPPPPFKIIILDEADSMTQDAQNALRRTMEVYSSNTRFCLICNFISRIIEPLASRCAKFRFKPIPNDVVISRLKEISEKENFPIGEDTLSSIATASGGDLRKAITNLQSLHATFSSIPSELTPAKVSELSGIVPTSFLDSFVESCESNSMVDLQNTVESIAANGFAADRFLSQLYDIVLQHSMWDDVAKGKIIEVIADADKCLIDGSDEFLQIMYVGSFMMKTLCEN